MFRRWETDERATSLSGLGVARGERDPHRASQLRKPCVISTPHAFNGSHNGHRGSWSRAPKGAMGATCRTRKSDARRCWGTGAKILQFFIFLFYFILFFKLLPSKRGARRRLQYRPRAASLLSTETVTRPPPFPVVLYPPCPCGCNAGQVDCERGRKCGQGDPRTLTLTESTLDRKRELQTTYYTFIIRPG